MPDIEEIDEIIQETEESTEPAEQPENDTSAVSAELEEMKNKYLRLAAEYDNFRKRSQKERESLRNDIAAQTAGEFLPVFDNLERALAVKTEDQAFYKGVEMIMTQFEDILSKLNITQIDAAGKEFDPNLHNAVMKISDDTLAENIVAEVFQQGFVMGDKVLRYATVKVANAE